MTLPRLAPVAVSSGHGRARPVLEVTEIGVERVCNACGELWPLDGEFFYRQHNGLLGFAGRCKACKNERRPAGDYHAGRAA